MSTKIDLIYDNISTLMFQINKQACLINWRVSLTLYTVSMRMKIFFFLKKKFEMADSKKLRFSTPPILNIFSLKFHGLVLGLVQLIDAKGIDVAQPIWP